MNYVEFTDSFLLRLAKSYKMGKVGLHALVDFDLWKQLFPDQDGQQGVLRWSQISFNAFTLDDEDHSLCLFYHIPLQNIKNEAMFIAIRFNKKRNELVYYSLRRPKYNDDPWIIFVYDFESERDYKIQEIQGASSLREFKAAIERLPFLPEASPYDKFTELISKGTFIKDLFQHKIKVAVF